MKLALGTVQFGLDYGVFGSGRQVEQPEVSAMLDHARTAGIDLLDTARAYGESESVLGTEKAADRFRIVTKCPRLDGAKNPAAELLANFDASCAALRTNWLAGYLLHSSRDIELPGVLEALEQLVTDGRVERFGVSAYGFDEAKALCARYPLTLVQLPANVLTPWFRNEGLPHTVEVHVRSAFLQGFLLSNPERLPDQFRPWRDTLDTFRARAAACGLTQHEAALAPLLHSPYIHRVVVGADNLTQLGELIFAAGVGFADLGDFPEVTPELTDPRYWKNNV